jgi:hypothetical protein
VIKELHLDGKNVYRSLSHRPTVILYLSLRLATKFLNENPKCLRFCPKFSNRLSDDVIISLGSQFSLSGDVVWESQLSAEPWYSQNSGSHHQCMFILIYVH